MKYYQISFPGEFGQHVDEIWSEKQILKCYWTFWNKKMYESGHADDVSEDRCIEDWTVTHWAVEVPKPEWITE